MNVKKNGIDYQVYDRNSDKVSWTLSVSNDVNSVETNDSILTKIVLPRKQNSVSSTCQKKIAGVIAFLRSGLIYNREFIIPKPGLTGKDELFLGCRFDHKTGRCTFT
jgi:hypothetical protein